MILCSDPHAQYIAHREEIDSAIRRVLNSGHYILGPETQAFEEEFAEYTGVSYCSGVANGTDALHIALKACGVGDGDEVITVSHTAVATVAAISLAGATPVLADIDPVTYTIDLDSLESRINSKTKAIIPVHLYGHPARMNEIMDLAVRRKLYVIEDCAQAHGATIEGRKVGSFGDLACFSFYPTKNLGALGDGGAVVSNNSRLADQVRLIREYGWKQRFHSETIGWNSRLDEIQAAVLRVKLKRLEDFNQARMEIAHDYSAALVHELLTLPVSSSECNHVYHLYVVRTESRDRLLQFLRDREIGAGIHYPLPVHLQKAYQVDGVVLPVTEQICTEILSLPIYPELASESAKVIAAVNDYFKNLQNKQMIED